jgi:hypothetical protein
MTMTERGAGWDNLYKTTFKNRIMGTQNSLLQPYLGSESDPTIMTEQFLRNQLNPDSNLRHFLVHLLPYLQII